MNILVTGGAGFIGSQLCERLLNDGHKVVCVDDMSAGLIENLMGILTNPSFTYIKQDVNDIEKLTNLLKQNDIEQIYHLAANSSILDGSKNTSLDFEQTFQSTFSVLEAMRIAGVKKLFFSSTSAVYGDKNNQPMTENMGDLFPENYYGGAKLASEAYISAFAKMNDFDVMIFRFANVIGPHLTHGVIFDFIKKLQQNPNRLEILGDGKQTKPYIYSVDLIDAICQKTYQIPSGINVFNCGVESCTSVKEIADIICKKLGLYNVEYVFTGNKTGWKGDVPKYQFDISKIKESGWIATYTSNQAVEKTVDDWLSKNIVSKTTQANQILNTIKARHSIVKNIAYLNREYQMQADINTMLEQNDATAQFKNQQQNCNYEISDVKGVISNNGLFNQPLKTENNTADKCDCTQQQPYQNKASLLSTFEQNEKMEANGLTNNVMPASFNQNNSNAIPLDITDKIMQDEAKSLEEEFINEISAENNFMGNTENFANKNNKTSQFNKQKENHFKNESAEEIFEEDKMLQSINQKDNTKTVIVMDENDTDNFVFEFETENTKSAT